VGLSGAPNRRSRGLALIGEAAELQLEPEHRTRLRDEAVKFLVLREVEAHEPELPTGRAHGLVFGPAGHRLAVLSEDDDELAFWDVERHQRQNSVSLRVGSGAGPVVGEPVSSEAISGDRNETGQNNASGSSTNRNAPGSAMTAPAGRLAPNRFGGQRLAQIGQCVAAVLPDDKGVALIDLVPGAPLRILNPPDHAVLSVVGDPGGTRLVTIEQVIEDPMAALDGQSAAEPFAPHYDLLVDLWDPEHLDRPIKKLQWTRPGPGRPIWPQVPLVTISPDGRIVAVAAFRQKFVKLFSAVDGEPLDRNAGRIQGSAPARNDGRGDPRYEIDTQTELSALAIGPNDSLATAGTTAGGVVIKIWNLGSPGAVPTSLTPLNQNFTRLMRFSPQGTLLRSRASDRSSSGIPRRTTWWPCSG